MTKIKVFNVVIHNEIFVFRFNLVMFSYRMNFKTHFAVIAKEVRGHDQEDLLNSSNVTKDIPETHDLKLKNVLMRVESNFLVIDDVCVVVIF